MALKVIRINKFYGDNHAVKDVTFEISKSGLYLLAGPNGSGKTTLLEILAKILTPSSGDLIYPDIISEKEFKKKIGILLQQNCVRKNITVSEELSFVSRIFNRAIDLKAYLLKFELYEHRHKKSQKLSGGLQRRLLIATLLIPNYEVIFFDEPASGLDVQTRDFIWSVIREHGKKKICIVSDHYLNQAASYCNQLLLMSSGKLLFQGEISELLSRFQYKTRIQVKPEGETELKKILSTDNRIFEVIHSGVLANYFVKDEIKVIPKRIVEISENVRIVTVEDVYLYLANEKEETYV